MPTGHPKADLPACDRTPGQGGPVIAVQFVSNWLEGEVVTRAMLDLSTGVVDDIEIASDCDGCDDYQHLIDERIESLDGQVEATVTRCPTTGDYRVADPSALARFSVSAPCRA